MTEDDLIRNPIIILGAPRSGTTMLGDLLSEHPTLALSVEPRFTWRYGNDRKSDMLNRDDATPAVKRHIRKTFANFVRKEGKERLVEKTPSNALRPEFVLEIFPDAKFIHVIRHGLDSILSIRDITTRHAHGIQGLAPGRLKQRLSELQLTRLHHYAIEFARRMSPKFLYPIIGQNAWGPRIPGMRAMMHELDPLEIAAIQWRMCVEITHNFGKQMPKEQFFEFKLEEMTQQKLESMLKFCNLTNNSAIMTHFEKNFEPSYASRQRVIADNEIKQRVLRQIQPTLAWLSY